MNRTIFEIGETPIAPGGSYGSDDFLIDFGDIFIYDIADSVGDLDEEDEKSRISNLFEKLSRETGSSFQSQFENDCASFILHEGFPEKYFKTRYEKFSERLENIRADLSLESFTKGVFWQRLWELSNTYEDKYDDYVVFDGELHTLDSFLRNVAEPEKEYYIGSVLNYHS